MIFSHKNNSKCSRRSHRRTSKLQLAHETLERRELLTANELIPFSYAAVDGIRTAEVDPSASYNATGKSIAADRTGVGKYTVDFEQLGQAGLGGGHVQVTSVDGTRYCKVRRWGSGEAPADFRATIDCYNNAGEFRDAEFNVAVMHRASVSAALPRNGFNEGYLYHAWAGQATTPSYTPSTTFAWNPLGDIDITRRSAGNYSVTFRGLGHNDFTGGTVQVSGYGVTVNRCAIQNWDKADNGGNDFTVNVGCTNPSGAAEDGQFTVAIVPANHFSTLGYAWTDRPTTAEYTPRAEFSYNPSGEDIIARRSGVGEYSVTFPGLNTSGDSTAHVQVTAYGATSNYCNLGSVEHAGTDVTASVNCFNANRDPVNTQFTVLVLPEPEGDRFEPNDTIEIATDLGSGRQTHGNLSILDCGGATEFCSVPDYYKWTASQSGTVDVGILFSHAAGNLDLELLNEGGAVLASSKSTTDNESLEWNVTAGTDYFIRVTGPNGWTNDYSMSIDPSVTATHDIFDVSFLPPSPADLFVNDKVDISFSYSTSHDDGIRIFVLPFTENGPTPNLAVQGSPLYNDSSGKGTSDFTVTSGEVVVDRIQFQIWDADSTELLHEEYVDVDFHFSPNVLNTISNIQFSPISPAMLDLNSQVEVTFDYSTTNEGGVRIFARPMTDGGLSPNYSASGSPLYADSSGSGSGTFTITSGDVNVDQVRLQMFNADQSSLLFEAFVDVDYEFSQRSGIVGDLNFDGLLNHADIDAVCRSVRNPPGQGDPRADLDRNGRHDLGDLRILVNDLMNTSFGDANLDRVFDSSDLVDLFKEAQYEDNTDNNSSWSSGDFNCDLEFDSSDLVEAFKGGQYELRLPGFVDLRPHFFMPPHTAGDADFDGTPSYFEVRTEMRISDDRTRIETRVRMDAQETKGDETRAEGRSSWETAYVAPGGHEIVDVLSAAGHSVSRVHLGTYNGDSRTFAGHDPKRHSVDSDLVNHYELILDTDGHEAGVRTGVRVHFESVSIELTEPRPFVGICRVPLADLNWMPPLVRGDNDWFGHGPLQASFVELQLRDGNIEGRVYLHAQEWDVETNLPKSDFTTFDGWSEWETLYSGDVTAILSDRHASHIVRPTGDPDIGIAISSDTISELIRSISYEDDLPGGDQAGIRIQFNDILVQKSDCSEPLTVPLRAHFAIPGLAAGDREFGGNGPEFDVRTSLRISGDRTRLETRMIINAVETTGDDPSHGFVRTGWETAYVAPSGQEIQAITSPVESYFNFTDTNHEPDFVNTTGIDLVRQYAIIGDIDGDDIGNTSVRALFRPATIELTPADSLSDDRITISPLSMSFRLPRVRADADFGTGHGPAIGGFVQTQILNGELQARVYGHIQEWLLGPAGNYSTYDGWSDWQTISSGLIPEGKKIKRLLSPPSSSFVHQVPFPGSALVFPGPDPVQEIVVFLNEDPIYMEVRFTEVEVELEDADE